VPVIPALLVELLDIALRFFAAHPQWADERIGACTHGGHSARRPIVVDAQAAPER